MAPVEFLITHRLTRQYGGLTAVNEVNFSLRHDRIHAIIGPNGAGKTTLVNLICGREKPTSGSIIYKGKEISQQSSAKRVQSGIVYTFQVTSIFSNLSCYENVALSVQRSLKAIQGKLLMVSESIIEEHVSKSLERVGLGGKENQTAGTLPYGHQKLLEVAMSLAADPELLILDEPTQGLAQAEIENLIALIRDISKSVNVLLIEHNMAVVFSLAEYVTVMDSGTIMAEGTPSEIENNREVQDLYLGN